MQVAMERSAEHLCGVDGCAVWQDPYLHHADAPGTDVCHAGYHCQREKEVSRLGTELKTSLANDNVQHVHTMVKAAFVERATGDDRAFWRGVQALRAHGPAGARMIALENGELAPTPYAGRQRWQRHFATLLCGEVLSSSDCVPAARHADNEREHVEPEADYVPTLDEVIARFSRLQNGKAVGELYRTFPHELARLLHPIFAKAALRSCEPWLWRGSLVYALPKKGKDVKLCEAYRDIPLACEAGKVHHEHSSDAPRS